MASVADSTDKLRPQERQNHGGYVLLMTLVLLAVCSVALTSACRLSLRQAVRARRDAEDLQRRWGTLSCQGTLLPKAEAVLSSVASRQPMRTSRADVSLRLGEQDLRLIFADEQAKVNATVLVGRRGRGQATQILQSLVRRYSPDLRVELRPLTVRRTEAITGGRSQTVLAFGSLGQIFPETDRAAGPAAILAATADVTCFGDGRLNVRRASASAMEALCSPPLSPTDIRNLLSAQTGGGQSLAQIAGALSADAGQREGLVRLLTESSSCHSLWVIHTSRGTTRYHLAVQDDSGGESGQITTFSW